MPYKVLYQRDAKDESQFLRSTYGNSFTKAFDDWITNLAETAQQKGEIPGAVALDKVLESLLTEDMPNDCIESWQRFKSASLLEKCKALVSLIRTHRPPWRARVVERNDLPGLDGAILVAVRLFLSVDDIEKQIVIRLVEQLES